MVDGAAAALSADGLTHRFGERTALSGVSFAVGAGELIAVIGPNGAGKTTLLSVLAGVLTPTSGSVRLAAAGDGAGRPSSRRVGWVPQEPALYSKLSVAENLRLFARLERVADPEASVSLMLEQTGLAERAGDQVKDLSGGNQQRVNIAIGLLSGPRVLLLDEPSSALDPRQRARLWEFISGLAGAGTSVVYSTHDVFEAQHHADRVLALDEGRLVFAGTPETMDWSY
ncbi:MAG TPA: heme ABC exporter ATP-binding protein CcmA [Solirubrobacteraceae bacterium]|jgi:ABC-2 type transport system ATP-binding protein|nr:heme ABC exporter ATP-binding protein CcmA [Solirubrobacteraceae bacterium]